MDYEEQLGKLTSTQKLEVYGPLHHLDLAKGTKLRMAFYNARKLNYL